MRTDEDLDQQCLDAIAREDDRDRKAGIDPDPVVLKLFDENTKLIQVMSGSGSVHRNGSVQTVSGDLLTLQRDQLNLARFCTVRGGKGQPTFSGELSSIEDSRPPRLIIRISDKRFR